MNWHKFMQAIIATIGLVLIIFAFALSWFALQYGMYSDITMIVILGSGIGAIGMAAGMTDSGRDRHK